MAAILHSCIVVAALRTGNDPVSLDRQSSCDTSRITKHSIRTVECREIESLPLRCKRSALPVELAPHVCHNSGPRWIQTTDLPGFLHPSALITELQAQESWVRMDFHHQHPRIAHGASKSWATDP